MSDYKRLTNKEKANAMRKNSKTKSTITFQELIDGYVRLAELEDKLESGRLVELPCKVGDTVYQTDTDGERIYESTIKRIIYDTGNIAFDETAIGTRIFLTKEESEALLKECRRRRNERDFIQGKAER